MKASPFAYHRPTTLPETLTLLDNLPDSRLLAGGQSLVPMLNLRVAMPAHIIDINRVAGLDAIVATDAAIRIGAMVRQSDLMQSEPIRQHLPLMVDAVHHIGHRATRARGTLGGSVCHLDPAAELPCIALAYNASLHIDGPCGARIARAADFLVGPMTPGLADKEMLTAVEFPVQPAGEGWGFAEFVPRHGDFAVVMAAARLQLSGDRVVRNAVLVLGGMGFAPVRVTAAEDCLIGSRLGPDRLREATTCCTTVPATDDARFPAWYRQRIATVMARQVLDEAARRAE
jgi:carbon-monoxide dehydrogenase medium subunit